MKNIKNIALLVCGLAGGIALVTLFRGGCNTKIDHTPVTSKQVKTLEEKTWQQQKAIQAQIDSINKASALLVSEVRVLNELLVKAKNKNQGLQAKVIYEAMKKPVPGDTFFQNGNCDTLREAAIQLVHSAAEKDSLYDAVLSRQEIRITQKDSLIGLHQQQYSALRLSFNESIEQQKLLADQNRSFQKRLRSQRIKNKLLSGLTVIAAGITTSYLLRR